MKLLIKISNQEEPAEIILTENEAKQIQQAIMAGPKFLKIGEQIINASYIIGLFDGEVRINRPDRLIQSPEPEKRDIAHIGKALEKMRKDLTKKGIIHN